VKSRAPILIGIALVVALLLVGALAGGSGSSHGPALSPTSTDPDGTRALVLLLRELGGDVRVGQKTPDAATRVALLLNDGLDDEGHARLDAWVRAGGTLVVTDPESPLSDRPSGLVAEALERGQCDIAGLGDVATLDASFVTTFRVRSVNQSCFGNGRQAFIVRSPVGQGSVVSLGSAGVFTNERLDKADNGVLALRLLAPAPGTAVAVLDPNPPGSGRTTLMDLVSDRVFQAVVQVGIAFVLYALWRSRRVGRPVREPQPVAIAGSQLVQAVGGLQQRTHAAFPAATALRADTRHLLSERYGIPLATPADAMAAVAAARAGLDRDAVAAALDDGPVFDDDELVRLSRQLDTIRQEVLDGRTG
jgi:hypothetical protein